MLRAALATSSLIAAAIVFAACSSNDSNSSSSGQNYPLIAPPVKAAAPTGFGGTAFVEAVPARGGARTLTALDPADFKQRFFGAGPTYIFRILSDIDSRIAGYNASTSKAACLTQTPVAYTLSAWGETINMYGQCYQLLGSSYTGDPGLVQWGVKDGVFYLYTAIGAGWTAAIATPITGTSNYKVEAWSSVGASNATGMTSWDAGSYGVIRIKADQSTKNFEMSVAGMGFGYCGAQYKSDGTNIYGIGSVDMASSCAAPATICVKASDASTSATCTTDQQTFTIPALGRVAGTGVAQANWGASAYPGGGSNTVHLTGLTSDDLHFGLTAPTSGVGAYQ